MPLNKQSVNINFAQGLDTKTDPYQVQVGKFLNLTNMIFDAAGRLTKRNGFPLVTTLPNTDQTTLTTLNNNLLATGSNLYAFNESSQEWYNQGTIQPITLSTQSIVRASTSQTEVDSAVTEAGLVCTVYLDNSVSYYQISDSNTGQLLVGRTALPGSAVNAQVRYFSTYFIITYIDGTHLQYIAIPIAEITASFSAVDISTTIAGAYDCTVTNGQLYIAYCSSGPVINIAYLTYNLTLSAAVALGNSLSTRMSITADSANQLLYISYYTATGYTPPAAAIKTTVIDIQLNIKIAPIDVIPIVTSSGNSPLVITSAAINNVCTVVAQLTNQYSDVGADPNTTRTDFLKTNTVTYNPLLITVTIGTPIIPVRSIGLGSKAFIGPNNNIYMLGAYQSANQNSYFIIDVSGNVYGRLAYQNGGGYVQSAYLSSVSIVNGTYVIAYRITDFLAPVNKTTDSTLPANAIFTQTGINLVKFTINDTNQYSSQIANTLHLTGGQLWMYDAKKPVEHGFQVWPEDISYATTTTTGHLTSQKYFYQFTYEWTDNQGNLHRSAPSIPLEIDLTGAGTSTNKNTLYVPTLRLTYKTGNNPVRIVGYRWSTTQQTYYQFTSLTSPTSNSTTVDYVTITDTLADSSILGNVLLYTTGGVIENIAAPASIASTLYKSRLFLADAEDQNLLWYSKQVIEATPVEMSDLSTIYIAPTSGVQGSTGPITALSAMDDKLIIFKRDAIYYITGNGPDNTGANNDFSDPVFVTSSVGCANPNSIVLMPQGIMFQSDKGIWLLGRDLGTQYIGAPVEAYNANTVKAALSIPATNQVRFTLDNNITLIYDYYYQQWGTFSNIQAISATLWQNSHTYLTSLGQILQETPNSYVDGTSPVLIGFTTSWLNVGGLRGFERFYQALLLGTYFTPFKLNVQIAYNFNSSPSQAILVTPDNYTPVWGGDAQWGSNVGWGGPGNVFQARLFPQIQKCQTFQLIVNEVYDSAFGQAAGQGLSLSGLNLVVGIKKSYSPQKASRTFG